MDSKFKSNAIALIEEMSKRIIKYNKSAFMTPIKEENNTLKRIISLNYYMKKNDIYTFYTTKLEFSLCKDTFIIRSISNYRAEDNIKISENILKDLFDQKENIYNGSLIMYTNSRDNDLCIDEDMNNKLRSFELSRLKMAADKEYDFKLLSNFDLNLNIYLDKIHYVLK